MKTLILLALLSLCSSQTLLQTCETVFQSYPTTKSVICVDGPSTSNATLFLDELLGDDRASFISNFLSIFSSINFGGLTSQDKDTFLASVMPYLQAQTYTNPPQYVSHGTDHSVRVMNWAIVLESVPQLATGLSTKYGMSLDQSKFVLGLMGLIHDTGYADLAQHHVPKWLHATSSSIFAAQILAANNNLGRRFLEAAGTSTSTLYSDFISAILYHNADDGFCKWQVDNANFMSQCFFLCEGNVTDPLSATTPLLNGKNYTRQFLQVSVETLPLSFAIRVADNLDAIRTRLTPVQDDPQMMDYFLRIYQDQELRNAVGQNYANISSYRDAARTRARQVSDLTNTTHAQDLVMNRADEQSWLHFYSNWILEGSIIDPLTWTIQVKLYNEDGTLSFYEHPGPGLYQINRLATSAVTCFLSNTSSFLDLVTFNFNLPIYGLDGSSFLPLRAFTKQPIYDVNGPANYTDGHSIDICNPFCNGLMPSLTWSPESCLDENNKATSDCDFEGFSRVPPFTDLTYPIELTALVSTDNALTKMDVGLTVGSAFLFVMLGMIIIFTYLYQKKKQELLAYIPISTNADPIEP